MVVPFGTARGGARAGRDGGGLWGRDGLAMADNALGPIAEITQIRLCCVAGVVPVMIDQEQSEAADVGASSALNRTGREGRLQHLPFV